MPCILNMICVFINCVLTTHPAIESNLFEHGPIEKNCIRNCWLVGWMVCFWSSTFYVSCKLNKTRNEAQIFTAKIITTTITINCDMYVNCTVYWYGVNFIANQVFSYWEWVENVHARTWAKKIQEKKTQSQKVHNSINATKGKHQKQLQIRAQYETLL